MSVLALFISKLPANLLITGMGGMSQGVIRWRESKNVWIGLSIGILHVRRIQPLQRSLPCIA
jgi:hypothetical protein